METVRFFVVAVVVGDDEGDGDEGEGGMVGAIISPVRFLC